MKYHAIFGSIDLEANTSGGIEDDDQLAQKLAELIIKHAPKEWGIEEVNIDFEESVKEPQE